MVYYILFQKLFSLIYVNLTLSKQALLKIMFSLIRKIYKPHRCFQSIINKSTAAAKDKNLIDCFINGKKVRVPSHFTILQALRSNGVTIPTFCYHDRLSIAGNCRMCLIEIEGWWKPQIACAVHVAKDMRIRTNSELTLKAQESVLEFILLYHPLDCPICDQGGECDLQDLSMRFGNDRSRFTDIHFDGKRAVEDKTLGPFIRCEMNRCIHCTRCIRFASQVAGCDVLGTSGRGDDMLVGTYVEGKMFLSELSGNIIDLCPVGALTSIPYMFKARPWEVKRKDSIDVTDATGTNIVLNFRFDRVIRVLPREHDEINQEWLSDKGRWAVDSLEMQRLVTPMTKDTTGTLRPVEWHKALCSSACILKEAKPERLMAIAGPQCNAETLVAAKDLLNCLNSENTYVERNLNYTVAGTDIRAAYSLNIKMKDVGTADKILLVGTNPRFEAPILNSWIRHAYVNNDCDIYVVGPCCQYNYFANYLGDTVADIEKVTTEFKKGKRPLIFVGISQLETPFASNLMSSLHQLAKGCTVDKSWNVVNIVTREASFAAALEAGWKPGAAQAIKQIEPSVLLSLGADQIFYDCDIPKQCKVIYIGFQGDLGTQRASVVLPGAAYSEAGGTYLNMEGRSQFAMPAVTPPGKARYDWKIIRALAEYTGVNFFYSDATSMACRLSQVSPNFIHFGKYEEKIFCDLIPTLINKGEAKSAKLKVDMKKIEDYYCSDVFTSNSPSMIRAYKDAVDFSFSKYVSN